MAKTIEQLKEILKSGVASHGLLLVGGDTVSIKNSIMEFLKQLEATAGNSSPLVDAEFFSASGGFAKSGERINGESLGIDAARRLKEFLSQKPMKSSQKTAVIIDGDTLTHQAQNALLKITEDPPPNSRIILTVKNEENLLPTLRSRFQKIHLIESDHFQKAVSRIPKEVARLADRFLISDARARSEVIKLITGKGSESEEDKTLVFLDALILSLAKDPAKHASFLGALLKQKALIASVSLNRRLQLAFLSSLWYNSQQEDKSF